MCIIQNLQRSRMYKSFTSPLRLMFELAVRPNVNGIAMPTPTQTLIAYLFTLINISETF